MTTLSLDSTIKLPRVINIGVGRCTFDSFEPARRTYDVDVTVETMCQNIRLPCDDVTPGLVVAGEMCSVTVCNHRQRTTKRWTVMTGRNKPRVLHLVKNLHWTFITYDYYIS